MSITFYSPEAPQVVRDTYECQCVDFSETGDPDPDCFHCQGSGVVKFYGSELELNVSNSNGLELLACLGLPQDYCGGVEGDERSEVLRTIMKRLNGNLDDGERESVVEGGETRVVTDSEGRQRIQKTATLVHCGRRAGYLHDRLRELQKLFKQAIDNNWTVVWC